ncbi:MAG: hypothetical protein H6619_01655 [Deltaproteobacteria bacterium]|nr:hypothetical protein [Deltaproteobacteria bacterium]
MIKTKLEQFLEVLIAAIVFAVIYYIVKLPIHNIPITYYDDGESLYHVFNILHGGIPYLEDHSHHFLGYVIHFLLGEKIFGLNLFLIKNVAFLNQVLVSIAVFLVSRLYFANHVALIAGLLTIVAREPFVLGFQIQYMINFYLYFLLYFSLLAIRKQNSSYLLLAYFLSSVAFVYDQRCLALVLIPIVASFQIIGFPSFKGATKSLTFYLTPILASLYYLYKNGALVPFYEQTFLYPSIYRIGSRSMIDLIWNAICIHKHLFSHMNVWFFGSALIGSIALYFNAANASPLSVKEKRLFTVILIPLLLMPSVGGRDFDYYTITWLPFFGICVAFGYDYISKQREALKLIYALLLFLSLLFPLVAAAGFMRSDMLQRYTGDGFTEVSEYLNRNLSADDTVYVWGYRMDLYVAIHKLSHFPHVNYIMIHPDRQVIGEDREKHIYPKYEDMFLDKLAKNPPTYFVTALHKERDELELDSKAQSEVFNAIDQRYEQVFESKKDAYNGVISIFTVYKLKPISR